MSGAAMFILGIIFLLIVAPIWIIAHYATQHVEHGRAFGGGEGQQFRRIILHAACLNDRPWSFNHAAL